MSELPLLTLKGRKLLPIVQGGMGVGVRVGWSAYFVSIALRMSLTLAPELYICIASRATFMQICQPTPW